MKKAVSPQCCETVDRSGPGMRAHYGQCLRKGIVERDGKHYCRQHDPIAKKSRDDARDKAWREQRAASQRRYAHEEASVAFCADVPEAEINRLMGQGITLKALVEEGLGS